MLFLTEIHLLINYFNIFRQKSMKSRDQFPNKSPVIFNVAREWLRSLTLTRHFIINLGYDYQILYFQTRHNAVAIQNETVILK